MAQTARPASFGPVSVVAGFHLLPQPYFVDSNLHMQ